MIDPDGTVRLFDATDGTGNLLREEALTAESPWYFRLMIVDATTAGLSAGDARLNLYSFSASSYAVNHAPGPAADAYEVYENALLTIAAAEGLLANDADPDGDALAATIVDGPTNGAVVVNADGSFEYTPGVDFVGADLFTYKLSDGELESDPIVVTIAVNPVNSVAGSVFEDIDADALRDINEGGLQGWTLQIDSMGTSGELIHTLMRPTNGAPDTDTGLETSVAFLGDNILVGAVYDDTGAVDAGAVHLYDGETGQYLRSFVDPTGKTDNRFGASVTAYGDDVLIAAPGQWGWNTGAVYLFDGDTGSLLSTFVSPEVENGIEFGASIAVVGDKILIGSPQSEYSYLAQNGAAYLYDVSSGELLHTFTNPGPYPADKFGRYVAALGDTIVISAAGNLDHSGVYQFDATSGELLHTFLDPEPEREGEFGVSMAVVGGDVLIGSTLGNWDSPAYLFDGQTGELLQTFEVPYSRLGDFGSAAVAVGDNILIGAQYEYTDQAWSGKAFLFDRATGEVLQTYTSEQTAQYGGFGRALASNGSRVLIGQNTQWTGTDQAQAYLFDTGTQFVTTDVDGNFQFDGLVDGTYRVRQLLTDGYTQTLPDGAGVYTVTLADGRDASGFVFANQQTTAIAGTVFSDTANKGVRDPNELGLEGWTVYLDMNDNGLLDDEPTAVTDELGRYEFDLLLPGSYTVRQEKPLGWLATTPIAGAWEVDLPYGQTLEDVDFGNYRLGTISGLVFEDSDGDGVQDDGELGLVNWTVYLDANLNGLLDDGEQWTTTGADGSYVFNEVMPGEHRLTEVVEAGWLLTTPRPGYYDLSVGSGQSLAMGRFGAIRPAVVAGNVFDDLDRDGARDLGEGGLGGWTVTLDRVETTTRALDRLRAPSAFSQALGRDLSNTIAFLGDRILLGSIYDDTGAVDSGVVHVFDRASGELLDTWANPNPDLQDQFGAKITVMGENVLVSTKNSAYRGNLVYLLDGATGDVLQQFDRPAGVYDRYFGETVVAWGNTVIISAPGGDGRSDGGSLRGGVVFFFDAASGELIREIQSPDPDRYDNFGGAMALVGDRLLVGSFGNDTVLQNSGSVFLFDTATGELLNEFTDSNPALEARLGRTITALGDDFLVSSSQQLYVLDGATGELLRTFDNPGRGWAAGTSLSAVGNNILVGSPDDNYSTDKAAWLGRAYLLDGMTGELLRTFENPDPDAGQQFGQFVASDGEMIIISHHSLLADPDITQAYIYDADTFTVQTDADGNYRFDGVRPGTYRVRAIAGGDYELSMPEGNGDYQAIVVSEYVEDDFDFGGLAIENWAAEAVGDSYTLEENTPLTVTDVVGVLANDVDRDGDALAAVLVSGPQHGVLTLASDGSFVYTSDEGFHGVDRFTYRADDGSPTSNVAEVTLLVEVVHSGSAEGLVFEDANQNGVQDEGELGLADWIVELERVDGPLELMQTYSRPLAPFWATDAGSASAVAFVGEDVLVGVEWDDSSGIDAGGVYRYDATTGQHLQTYLNPEERWNRFGKSVAAIGDNVLVGSQNAAYLFDGATGELLHKFTSPVPYSWSFGDSVAAIGDNVLIAAPYAPSSEVNLAGAVYLFDGDTYELLQTFTSPDPDAYDQFGRHIAAVGKNVLIGADGDDTQRANGGVSYLYDGATGELLRTFADSGGYGHAVAAAGENVLVGDSNGVSLYDGATGELLQTYVSPSSYTWSFGQTLAAIDGKVLVGAPQERVGNVWGSGVVYVFDMESGDLLQTLSSPESGLRGHFGGSIDVIGDRVLIGQDSHWTGESMVQAYSFDIDRFVVSTITDDQGRYDFSGLKPGTYVVRQTPGDGFIQTSPLETGEYTIHLDEDGTVSGLDFGDMRLVAPEAADDEYTMDDAVLTVLPEGVLANDTDANGDPLVASLLTDAEHGQLTLGDDGSFTYTPDAGFAGVDSFTYVATDGVLDSNTATVRITVYQANAAPVAEDDTYWTELGATLAIDADGVLANDTDDDADPLSAMLVDGPTHGGLTLGDDGSFVYTPDEGFTGFDTFTYKASDGQVDSEIATVRIAVVDDDLGGIHVVEMPHLNPAAGDIWYGFRATRNALITLWAQGSDDVTITLYDANLNEVALWTPGNGNQRIEYPAEAGQQFFFRLSGSDDDVNVHLANVIKMNNGHVTVFGSDGDDQFELAAADLIAAGDDQSGGPSSPLAIMINGVEYTINPTELVSFEIDGGQGDDSVVVYGSAGDDTLRISPQEATLVGPGYRVDVVNASTITVIGGGGNDVAHLYDSAGADRFFGRSTVSVIAGAGYLNKVRGFDQVVAHATAGGSDRAYLYDSAGADEFHGKSNVSWMLGETYRNVASGFDQVSAFATAGGEDLAFLYDSAGNDRFVGTAIHARLLGDGFHNFARGFDRVSAYSTEGGSDLAYFFDSAGDDRFVAKADFGRMTGDGFDNLAQGFDRVSAYASAGGSDVAQFHDSAGDDRFTATSTFARMNGDGFSNFARGFDQVDAYATAGGSDVAYLFDSAGNDSFIATAVSGRMMGAGFNNLAHGFDRVNALATAGGSDVASFHDSAGNDRFMATATYARMNGQGFINFARGFDRVSAYATAGGQDFAYFYDSAGADHFIGTSTYARLGGDGFNNFAAGFDRVNAYSRNGGADRASLHDSAGNDQFIGTSAYARMKGAGFDNIARGFGRVDAYATAGGTDRAYLYDSALDDLLEAAGSLIRLTSAELTTSAYGFSWVRASATTGGTNTQGVQAIDFLLETNGFED